MFTDLWLSLKFQLIIQYNLICIQCIHHSLNTNYTGVFPMVVIVHYTNHCVVVYVDDLLLFSTIQGLQRKRRNILDNMRCMIRVKQGGPLQWKSPEIELSIQSQLINTSTSKKYSLVSDFTTQSWSPPRWLWTWSFQHWRPQLWTNNYISQCLAHSCTWQLGYIPTSCVPSTTSPKIPLPQDQSTYWWWNESIGT